MPSYLAIDLGAESGRVIRGTIADGKLSLETINRFPTATNSVLGRLYWDVIRIFDAMKEGFAAAAKDGPAPESVGVDTWGVDFALLAEDGSLAGFPVAYRDKRTDGMIDALCERMPAKDIYAKTGIQFQFFNTTNQLLSLSIENSPFLDIAKDFLFMPDLFHYFFTGNKTNEYTIASTSQLLNAETGEYDPDILKAIGVDPSIFQKIVQPGEVVGTLTEEIQKETGLGPVQVIAPATHDTGSAVAAVPAEGEGWCYLSSGTWSLLGLEIPEPITTEKTREYNFTNEGGVDNTIRFIKNVMGLWLVQRLRAGFDTEHEYGALAEMAAEAKPFVSFVDPDDERFINPASMPDAFAEFCRETSQPVPETPGAFVRCALESLALQYRAVIREMGEVQDRPIDRMHIVGGGTQNTLLNQMTADSTGLKVIAGPVEATAIGNLIVQARALGHVGSLAEARTLVRNSFPLDTYEAKDHAAWNEPWERFQKIKQQA